MNNSNIKHPILVEPIQVMPLSPEFKQMARVNGFLTLQDILDGSLDRLHELPSSGYRMLKELGDILAENGLEELLND